MTTTANGHRPRFSPKASPGLHATVTDRDPATCSAGSSDTPPERETSTSGTPGSRPAITQRDGVGEWGRRFLAYFTPPSILTDRPASIPELAVYAHEGGWTRQQHGALRGAGIWWWRLVGLPKTVISRYREWIWQRPGRAIPVLLLIKLLALTGPGSWLVDHLFLPAVRAAVWLLL